MATIRQRGTKWQAIVKRKGHPPCTKSFSLYKDAEKWARHQERLIVAAGESGVAGVSVDRAEHEIAFNASQDIATIQKNRRNSITQSQSQARMNSVQASNTITNSRPNSFNSIGAGLQVYGAAGGFKADPQVPAK